MVPKHTKAIRKNGSVKMNHYYACGNYLSKGIAACKPNSVRADDIEKWFFDQLQTLVNTPQITKHITASILAKKNAISSPIQEQVDLLRDELNKLEAERKRLFKAFEDGDISKEELKVLMGEMQARSYELQARKDDTEQRVHASNAENTDSAQVHSAIRKIREVLHSVKEKQQQEFLRYFFDQITLPPDRNIEKAKLHGTGPFGQVDVQSVLREEWRA